MSANSKPLVELFVKASTTNKKEKGACLIGQQWFMVLYSLVERGLIDLRFTPVALDDPPYNYFKLNAARHLPIAWIESGTLNGQKVSDVLIQSWEALEIFMDRLNNANLNPQVSQTDVRQAERVFEDLINHMMQFVRYNKEKPLLNTLEKIDNFLTSKGERFLLDSEITYPDCQLMPKLQHMRVVCGACKNFDIPQQFKSLCNYVANMYRTRAFIYSCPSDRDILLHYMEKNAIAKDMRLNLLGSDFLCEAPGSSHKYETVVNGSLSS
ncbi:unnamed protein product [Echinostoma caproni]|uniref:GST N-terminal domain-containing protein n=1 Tax=Echinostoma caproni TaxID=27848 RepID=A0A183B9X5_9TREM|nr:unnamed protein product [Echinostoma caproni]